MLTFLSLWAANIFGWIVAHWKWVLGAVALIVLVLVLRSCFGGKYIPIDHEALKRINSENAKERRAELQEVIEANQDVISTVDNRSTLAETNVIERNREIDARIAEADKKIVEAKAQGRDVTSAELECILLKLEGC